MLICAQWIVANARWAKSWIQFYYKSLMQLTNPMVSHWSLKDLKKFKKSKRLSMNTNKLKSIWTSYKMPFLKEAPKVGKNQEQFWHQQATDNDFVANCKQVCSQLYFHLLVFCRIFKESQRKKTYLQKLYGYDRQDLQKILFCKDQVRHDLSPQLVYSELEFHTKSLKARNRLSKLKLFVTELIDFNRRQQDLDNKILQTRVVDSFRLLDQQFKNIVSKKERASLLPVVDSMTKMQEIMMRSKLRIRNKEQSIHKIATNTGNIAVHQYYIEQERKLHELQTFFCHQRQSK